MDEDRRRAFALRVWTYKQGEVVSLMIHLGDELGVYRAMAGAGPLDAAALAARTGLQARWLLEWLRGQAAAGLLETDDGERFELGGEAADVLANDRDSTWFAAGAFHGGVVADDVRPRLLDAFRTGRGLSYDELGPSAAHAVERILEPWTRLVLVPELLERLDGVVARLERGGRAVDVGCGAGVAVEALAQRFPDASIEGYDPSHHAIERARDRVAAAGLANVTLHQEPAESLPAGAGYDLVMTLDCLHDLCRPAEAMRAIRSAIAADGTWLVKEIRCSPRWSDNLRNPVLAMLYGTSVATCMSSALSEPGGAGLGTLGLHTELLESLAREAGFTRCAVHDVGEPANLYYELRP